jgi:hypothetical protein
LTVIVSFPTLVPLVWDTYRPPWALVSVRTAIGVVSVPASASATIGWAIGGVVVGGGVVGGVVVAAGVLTDVGADAGEVLPAASRATTA